MMSGVTFPVTRRGKLEVAWRSSRRRGRYHTFDRTHVHRRTHRKAGIKNASLPRLSLPTVAERAGRSMARPVPGRGESASGGIPRPPMRGTGMHGARRYRVPRDAEPATSPTGLTYSARTETPRLCRVKLPPSDRPGSTHRFAGCDGRCDPERGWGTLAVHGEEGVMPSCSSCWVVCSRWCISGCGYPSTRRRSSSSATSEPTVSSRSPASRTTSPRGSTSSRSRRSPSPSTRTS